ncbi:MAG: histone deacetylase [bacterium]
MQTGLIYHPDFLKHDTGHHPENKLRLAKTFDYLEKTGALKKLSLIKFDEASEDDIGLIHTAGHIREVKNAYSQGINFLDPDTPVSEQSYKTALLAAGGVLKACVEVSSENIKNAFCLIRPPGHHAAPARSMGFCLFNNAAIAARYLQKHLNHQKILIIDWDAHHGNGTQDAFYDDPSVLYFSTHRYPFYPGSGSSEEKGDGKGFGFNINVPLPSGSGDKEYISAFEKILIPAAEKFKPEFILISAGFDAHIEDPLGGMAVTDEGFKRLTEITINLSKKHCGNKIVSVLEGGYSLKALPKTIAAHLEVLMSA